MGRAAADGIGMDEVPFVSLIAAPMAAAYAKWLLNASWCVD